MKCFPVIFYSDAFYIQWLKNVLFMRHEDAKKSLKIGIASYVKTEKLHKILQNKKITLDSGKKYGIIKWYKNPYSYS